MSAGSAACSVETGGGLNNSIDSEKELDEDNKDGAMAIIENLIEMIVSRKECGKWLTEQKFSMLYKLGSLDALGLITLNDMS